MNDSEIKKRFMSAKWWHVVLFQRNMSIGY